MKSLRWETSFFVRDIRNTRNLMWRMIAKKKTSDKKINLIRSIKVKRNKAKAGNPLSLLLKNPSNAFFVTRSLFII